MKKQYILLDGFVRSIKPDRDVREVIDKLVAKGHKVEKISQPPTIRTLEKWVSDGVAKATDGCRVETDGECTHGHKSWLVVLGMI